MMVYLGAVPLCFPPLSVTKICRQKSKTLKDKNEPGTTKARRSSCEKTVVELYSGYLKVAEAVMATLATWKNISELFRKFRD